PFDDIERIDTVAERLRHLCEFSISVFIGRRLARLAINKRVRDHPLREQPLEWFGAIEKSEVAHHLRKKTRVEQMQNRMLNSTDVLIDGHPRLRRLSRKRELRITRIAIAREIPGRIDESVHRVGFATACAAALRAGHAQKSFG